VTPLFPVPDPVDLRHDRWLVEQRDRDRLLIGADMRTPSAAAATVFRLTGCTRTSGQSLRAPYRQLIWLAHVHAYMKEAHRPDWLLRWVEIEPIPRLAFTGHATVGEMTPRRYVTEFCLLLGVAHPYVRAGEPGLRRAIAEGFVS